MNLGNSHLLNEDLGPLNKKIFLCSNHFSDDQFYSSERKTLLPTAIPTLFGKLALVEVDLETDPRTESGEY